MRIPPQLYFHAMVFARFTLYCPFLSRSLEPIAPAEELKCFLRRVLSMMEAPARFQELCIGRTGFVCGACTKKFGGITPWLPDVSRLPIWLRYLRSPRRLRACSRCGVIRLFSQVPNSSPLHVFKCFQLRCSVCSVVFASGRS